MNFFSSFLKWMTTSSSIIGTAVGVPAIAGVLTGTVPLSQAVLPIAGALISIAMPQIAAAIAAPDTVTPAQALASVAFTASQVAAMTQTRVGNTVAVAIPVVADVFAELTQKYNDASAQVQTLNAQMAAAAAAHAALTAVIPTPVTALTAPVYVPTA